MNAFKSLLITGLVASFAFGANLLETKFGSVEYQMKENNKVVGTNKIVFKDYGKTMLVRLDSKTQPKMILKIQGDDIYMANTEQKSIIKLPSNQLPQNMLNKSSAQALKDMGAKKIGTDRILGYKCDMYKSDDMKTCIYKGLALYSEIKLDSKTTSSQVAIKLNLKTQPKNSEFNLPKYKELSLDGLMKDLIK